MELMYGTFTDYSGLVIALHVYMHVSMHMEHMLCISIIMAMFSFLKVKEFLVFNRYSPQTSICVYRANNSDALVPNGLNNRGVFDIFRSQVYDPMSGKSIANAFVQVQGM